MIKNFKCKHPKPFMKAVIRSNLERLRLKLNVCKLQMFDNAVELIDLRSPPGNKLEPLGMSVNALATALRVPAPRINDVVRQKRAVSVDTALRLARYCNTTAQFGLNLHQL